MPKNEEQITHGHVGRDRLKKPPYALQNRYIPLPNEKDRRHKLSLLPPNDVDLAREREEPVVHRDT